jgi:hypothetical protein
MFEIDFEWAVDQAGYDWVSGGPLDPNEENSLIGQLQSLVAGRPLRPDCIVPRGGKLQTVRPFRVPGLHRYFAANATTPEGLLRFVSQFGPMTADGNRECGEEALIGICAAETMSKLLADYASSPADCFARFGEGGLAWSRIDVRLAFNPITRRPQYIFTPPTLVNALWLELGQAVTSDAQWRQCVHCGGWFEAGPGTGRRADARFCSDEHRIAFNSQKRSKGVRHAS